MENQEARTAWMTPEKYQAKIMARVSDIVLSEEQLSDYILSRQSPDMSGLSDQRIMFLLLDSEQQAKFRRAFSDINFAFRETSAHIL